MQELVSEADHVESVYRLYGFLCFVVLYFLRTFRTVTNLPFRLLDNLDNLTKYWWVSYVHNFLIASLNRSSIVYKERANDHTIFVSSLVVVVQVYVFFNFNNLNMFFVL